MAQSFILGSKPDEGPKDIYPDTPLTLDLYDCFGWDIPSNYLGLSKDCNMTWCSEDDVSQRYATNGCRAKGH